MTTINYQRNSRDDVPGHIIVDHDDGRRELIDAFPDEAPAKVAELRAQYDKAADYAKPAERNSKPA